MSTVPRVAAGNLKEAFALQPDLYAAFSELYGRVWMDGVVDHPTKEVARLRNARVTDCGYCKKVRFSLAREEGLTEDMAELVDDSYGASALSERHKAAIRLADRFLAAPAEPRPAEPRQAQPRQYGAPSGEPALSRAEEVELGVALSMFIGFAKMLITLGLEPEDMPLTVVPTPGSVRPAVGADAGA